MKRTRDQMEGLRFLGKDLYPKKKDLKQCKCGAWFKACKSDKCKPCRAG
jgi:hypothetical protein